jgi:hypothetical protein
MADAIWSASAGVTATSNPSFRICCTWSPVGFAGRPGSFPAAICWSRAVTSMSARAAASSGVTGSCIGPGASSVSVNCSARSAASCASCAASTSAWFGAGATGFCSASARALAIKASDASAVGGRVFPPGDRTSMSTMPGAYHWSEVFSASGVHGASNVVRPVRL